MVHAHGNADDSPLYSLNAPFSPVDYSSKSYYRVIVVVKPTNFSYDDGIWCPIKAFEWSWGAETRYKSNDGTWEKPKVLFQNGLSPFNIYLPEWSDHAHPYYKTVSGAEFPENPPWRDK